MEWAGSRLLHGTCHTWSEPLWGISNAGGQGREASGRAGVRCRGGESRIGIEAGTALKSEIKMSQLYQLMARGVLEDVNVSISLSGKHPALHTFPNGKLLQQQSQRRLHTGQVGELVRPAPMPGRGAVLLGTAQTWWCRTQTPVCAGYLLPCLAFQVSLVPR